MELSEFDQKILDIQNVIEHGMYAESNDIIASAIAMLTELDAPAFSDRMRKLMESEREAAAEAMGSYHPNIHKYGFAIDVLDGLLRDGENYRLQFCHEEQIDKDGFYIKMKDMPKDFW